MKEVIEEVKPEYGETFQIEMRTTTNAVNAYSPPHVHDFIEILYCFRGEYCVLVNGELFELRPGYMLVINSRQIHEVYPAYSVKGEFLAVKFQPEMIYAAYNSAIELQYALLFLFGEWERVFQPLELETVFMDVALEVKNKNYGYEMALKSDIYKIILWIIRNSNRKIEKLNIYTESSIRRIISAISYIEKHYMENITVRQIADYAYLEYTYFSRMFKQITKKSCTEYINQFRVQKAEVLLISTKRSITEIAEEVGFDNVSYFIKQFRRVKGLSPKQYQKRNLYKYF